jgi:hypothetical protein
MKRATSRQTALEAFVAKKAEIDAMLARLQAYSEERFGYGPDEISWGHIGILSAYAAFLRQLTDAAFKEGKYAR